MAFQLRRAAAIPLASSARVGGGLRERRRLVNQHRHKRREREEHRRCEKDVVKGRLPRLEPWPEQNNRSRNRQHTPHGGVEEHQSAPAGDWHELALQGREHQQVEPIAHREARIEREIDHCQEQRMPACQDRPGCRQQAKAASQRQRGYHKRPLLQRHSRQPAGKGQRRKALAEATDHRQHAPQKARVGHRIENGRHDDRLCLEDPADPHRHLVGRDHKQVPLHTLR